MKSRRVVVSFEFPSQLSAESIKQTVEMWLSDAENIEVNVIRPTKPKPATGHIGQWPERKARTKKRTAK